MSHPFSNIHTSLPKNNSSLIHLLNEDKRVAYLSELPGDANSPAQPIAADQQSLHGPTPEMPKSKYIKVAEDSLPGDNMTVHSILLLMKKNKTNKTPQ